MNTSIREYIHRIRYRLSTSRIESSEKKGKSDVELVDITGSSFLLDNIELETDSAQDVVDTGVSTGRVTSVHGIRKNRYMRITPESRKRDGSVNKGNLVSGADEDSISKTVAHSESASSNDGVTNREGKMPRYDASESVPLRGGNSSEWTAQEDPTGLIAATYLKHKRMLLFILSASILALAVMATLAVTAVVLRNSFSTPTENQTLSSESHLTVQSAVNKWILPDVQERKSAMLRQSPLNTQPGVKDSNGNFRINGKPEYSVNPTPIIIPIPLFFKSANESEMRKALVTGNDALHKREMVESELLTKGFVPQKSSPTYHHQYFGRSNPKAKKLALLGYKMENAYKSISTRMNLSKIEAANGALKLSENNTVPVEWCEPQLVSECNETTEIYRTYDGSCNNLKHPSWGSANTPFRRILQPDYVDGISQPRSVSEDGSLLPNPAEISSKIHLDLYKDDSQASMLLPLWGQFLSHDLILTATSSGKNITPISCCDNDLPLSLQHPECIPLVYHSQSTNKSQCTSVTRSAPYPGCELGPRLQFNQVSSFLDASNIYGTPDSDLAKDSLRMSHQGLLKESETADGRFLLPVTDDPNDGCNSEAEMIKKDFCFKAGDQRVNVDTGVTSMYTIWMRQHNEIADNLVLLNRHWDDEKIFQESRKILIAQIQHITYNEFLPVVLGQEIMNKSELQLLQDEYYQEYDPKMDPTISNVFSTAAFRFIDSMIRGYIKMVDPMGKSEEFVQLHKLMVNPFLLWTKGKMDALMKGLATTPAAKVDAYFTSQLSNYMSSGVNNSSEGLDLVAINIQRGRDFGLASYTAWRKVCGLSAVEDFSQLENDWDDGASVLISNIYKSVNDVDIYTGILAEKPTSGAIVGPTLACLLTDQFLRLKKGDRYWYEGDIQLKPFSPDQLTTIRQTTLARIICDNSDNLEEIQLKPMLQKSEANPNVNCADLDIPKVNYGAWRELSMNSSGNKSQNETDKSYQDLDKEIWGKSDLNKSKENVKPLNGHLDSNNGTVTQSNGTRPQKAATSQSVENITRSNNSTPRSMEILPITENILELLSFNLTRKGNGEVVIQWPKSNSSSSKEE